MLVIKFFFFSQLVFLTLKSHCYSVVLLLLVDYIYQDVRFIKSEDDWFQLYSMTVFFSHTTLLGTVTASVCPL